MHWKKKKKNNKMKEIRNNIQKDTLKTKRKIYK